MKAAAFALLLLCGLVAHAEPLDPRYEYRAAHDPDGIGKFYLGREIAQSWGRAASWLERTERETEEQPQLVIDALEIKPGQTIADLGAGSGYYSFRIAPLVGPTGKVLAIDIEPTMLEVIAQRASREHVSNIATIRSSARDPNLAPAQRRPAVHGRRVPRVRISLRGDDQGARGAEARRSASR